MYVFTPKGRVISLPAGASALDFAFRIHTEIGLHAAGAKINGKPSPLRTPLRTGDIVEIITSPGTRARPRLADDGLHLGRPAPDQAPAQPAGPSSGPSPWAGSCGTAKSPATGCPPAFPGEPTFSSRLTDAVPVPVRSTWMIFSPFVGRGKIILEPEISRTDFASRPASPGGRARPAIRLEIQVKDRSRELVRLAKCCAPIQGEPIVGYLTAGKGITVHAGRCPRIVKELLSPDRLVEVSWGDLTPVIYKAGSTVSAEDRPGLLAKVTAAVAAREGDIIKAEVATFAEKKAEIRMTLKIRDIRHLEDIRAEIGRDRGRRFRRPDVSGGQTAFWTFPERRQRVQAQTYLFPASVLALTRWRLGFHFFGEALWEWLTEFPKTGPLPQMSHVFGMVVLSISLLKGLFYTINGRGFKLRRLRW